MKVVTIVGARPQFVKAAAVSRAIGSTAGVDEIIVHTGQHFDARMSDIFFREMQIPAPNYQLNVNSMSHGAMTGRMLEKIEEVLLQERPEAVLVYGDTNSTLAGALAAKKLHLKVVHVEAGLRSFNLRMPEEVNRILTDRISDLLCCPTDTAIANLQREGFASFDCTVDKTGDVMQDAALFYSAISASHSTILRDLGLEHREFILCTVHRAENTDDPQRLAEIVDALNEVAINLPVVLPLHPRTRKLLPQCGRKLNFEPIEPVGYFDMIELLKSTALVMTDSGGVQKEAFFFGRPCVTLRDETEWTELVDIGANRLAGASRATIVDAVAALRVTAGTFDADLYGGGNASHRIVELLQRM